LPRGNLHPGYDQAKNAGHKRDYPARTEKLDEWGKANQRIRMNLTTFCFYWQIEFLKGCFFYCEGPEQYSFLLGH
jgi:hypothetical protein